MIRTENLTKRFGDKIAVNDLTLPAVDPRSNEPNFKQCAVELVAPDPSNPLSRQGIPDPGVVDSTAEGD